MDLHKNLVHLEAGSEAGRVEGAQAFACWIGDYRGLLLVVDAAHSRIAISLLGVPQQTLSGQVTA